MNTFDKQHKKNLTQYEQQIGDLMDKAQQQVALQISLLARDLKDDSPFRWADYPVAKQRMDTLAKQLTQDLQQSIENGITQEWALSNQKNDHFTQSAFGEYLQQLPEERRAQYLNNNQEALEAFKQRKVQGLGLSSRVWNITKEYKEEVEMAIDTAIRDGLPATQLATRLKQYLHNPDALFRRVRNRWGELELSKHARAYHPGQGVYRSAYKNARRTAATEINIAYRTSDYDRWQQMDFVVGIEIEPSHTNHPDHDLCDTLAGKYPKAFKFTGWHPHCRCIATPILKTKQEMQRDTERIMQGGEPEPRSKNTQTTIPKKALQWAKKNEEVIMRRGSVPYFLQDNLPTVFCYPENKPMRPLVRNMLQRHGDYEQIEYNHTTGGLLAVQQGHNLDRGKGWYETTAAHVGYENGHAVILTLEDHSKLYVKNTDGTWDGQVMEIAAVETGTANNIRNALKHCACKPNTEVAVLIFPNDNFNAKELAHGMAKYYGLRQTKQYKSFHSIYCIQAKQGTIQKFKPAPVTDTETQA